MEVRLEDGTIIKNVPPGTTKAMLTARLNKAGAQPVREGGNTGQSPDDIKLNEVVKATNPAQGPAYGFGDEVIDQGLMLGFGDEAKAGLGAAFDAVGNLLRGRSADIGANYDRHLVSERKKRAAWTEDNPVAKIGAQVLGGAATMGIAPARGVAALVQAPSAAAQIGRGAAVGVPLGGAAGFGGSEGGIENRLLGAAGGAAVGGALGAAIPAVATGVGATYRAGRTMLGRSNPEDVASSHIARAIERSGLTQEEIAQGVSGANAAGVPAVPADVSPSLRRLGRAVETVPGRGGDAATRFLEERQTGQGARVSRQISRALGTEGDAVGMAEQIMQARAQEARPLYEEAYKAQAWDDSLQEITRRPVIRQALARARRIAANEGVDPATLGITGFNEAGDPILSGIPTMRTWDYVKRGLDDIIEKGRNPVTGRLELDEAGRSVQGVKSTLLRQLDAINPDYAAARRSYAGHSEMLDAVNLGRDFAKGDVDLVTQRFTEMSPAEQDMFRVGAVRELRRTIGKAQDGADIVRTLLGSPEKRARMQMLFRTPEEYQTFQRIMEMERETTRTNQMVRGGSPTGRIAADQSDLLAGALEDAVRGSGPVAMARNAAVRMISRAKGINEDVAGRIADYLFNQNPQTGGAPDPELINSLLEAAGSRRAVTRATSQGGAVALSPTSRDR